LLFRGSWKSNRINRLHISRALTTTPSQAPLTQFNISDNPGARKRAIRWARGPGSGRGKTAGRGHKGQKAREGHKIKPWFEGGKTPLHRRLPKIGVPNLPNKLELTPLTIGRVIEFIRKGRLDPRETITMRKLWKSGAVTKIYDGVKLSEEGSELLEQLKVPLRIEVLDSTEASQQAVAAAGGLVKNVWFNRVTLRAHLKPEKFLRLPRSNGIPPPRFAKKYPDIHPGLIEKHRTDEKFKKF